MNNALAESNPLRKLLPDLAPFQWREVTDAMRERGFAQLTSRYLEVTHDMGSTIVVLDEDGDASVFLGVEIDWCDVLAADVLGGRRYRADLTISEEIERDSQLPEVA